jgi:hypothetical protein
MTGDVVIQECRMMGEPVLDSLDVFVDPKSDRRYVVHEVSYAGELRGYPVVTLGSVRRADFSDVVYRIPLTGS